MKISTLLLNRIMIYEFIYLFVITVSILFLIYIILNIKKSELKAHYVFIHILLVGALFCNILFLLSTSNEFLFTIYLIKYIFVSVLSIAIINFIYNYINNKNINPIILLLLSLLPLITFLTILTNPMHHLFFITMDYINTKPGIMFYVLSIIRDIYIVSGLFMLLKKYKMLSSEQKKEMMYVILTVILIFVLKTYYYIDERSILFDATIIIANISIIVLGHIILLTQFSNIEAYGIDEAINQLKEGIVILNRDKKIMAINQSFEKLIAKAYKKDIIDSKDLIKSYQNILDNNSLLPNQGVLEYVQDKEDEEDNIYLNVVESTVYNKKNIISGYILIFKDISEYMIMKEMLQLKNIELTKIRVKLENHINNIKIIDSLEKRNRLAKELHDILGHTLTITNLKLKYCIDKFDEDIDQTKNNIAEIKNIVEKGIKQLSDSIDTEEIFESVSLLRLQQELNRLSDTISANGINLDVTVKGVYKMIEVKIYNTIYRVCQEAVTNTIKHSDAENIYIIIRNNDRKIDINIFDDGKGCKSIKKGNGLSGMEQRIEEVGGTIKFTSIINEGFYIKGQINLVS